MTNHETFAYTPPSARQLLTDHGLPEDVIDGVLCLHAQEMAAVQRNVHDTMRPYFHLGQPCSPDFDCHVAKVIDLIDPTRAAPAAVSVPPPAPRADAWLDAAAYLETLDPAEAALSGQYAWHNAAAHLRRKAGEDLFAATPCSPIVGCEPGGEPCDTHERLLGHIEGDHELCGPECSGPCVAGEQQNETPEAATVHAVPLPGSNGISSCCGRPPCEFVGERVTRDPDKVTCTGPTAGVRQDGAQP